MVSRCFSVFFGRAPAATKKAGRYDTKAAGFRRPVAAFLRAPRAPSVRKACSVARVPPRRRRSVPSFRAVCRSGSCLPCGGAPPSSGPPERLHAKHPACTVSRCKRGACGSGRKRAAGQKRGPLSPCPPCPPPCGGMTGRNLPPGRPSGPWPSGGSGILAPPKMLRR